MLSQYGTPCTGCPVVARPRGDFRGDRPEGRRQPVPDRLERAQRSPSSPRAGPSAPSCTRRGGGGAAGRRQAWAEDGSQRMRKSQIEKPRDRIALSAFCYRRRKTLAPQGPRKLPKLDVAGSTPVARSLSEVDSYSGTPASRNAAAKASRISGLTNPANSKKRRARKVGSSSKSRRASALASSMRPAMASAEACSA